MASIIVRGSSNGVYVSGINNEQLPEALKLVLAECERQYGSIPVNITIRSWDMDYGDALAEAFIEARPEKDCWEFERRLKKQQANMATA
jgi:hypothetical protein